ncbi:hypothetical protein GOBAR_AA04467 [Gossypium barbadense]|uniref:Uncharacterized protein n=1 Tax=Gossypium barbadense TaxID=3634 RepID=A0A2P5YKL5_GOSBA|nr:hypothetical protein GOBAR_AA04467 [Gossypium barbadense]
MSSSCGKKTVVRASKQQKGASSSGLTAKIPLLTTDSWDLFFAIIEPAYLELIIELCSTFYVQDVMTNFDDPETRSSWMRTTLTLSVATSTTLPRSAGTLWSPVQPSTTRATPRHQLSLPPRGISSMLSMRMIEKRRGTHPPEYRLAQSAEEGDPEDITDDVPPRHEDQPSQPPPPSHPVHAAASYTNISERLTRFEHKAPQAHHHIGSKNSTGKRFSTTAMSYSTMTIATTKYNILLAQDLWTNEPLTPLKYPPPLSRRLFSRTPVQ